jgi:hypothetical protein
LQCSQALCSCTCSYRIPTRINATGACCAQPHETAASEKERFRECEAPKILNCKSMMTFDIRQSEMIAKITETAIYLQR